MKSPVISPSEKYLQVYEALDTVSEDIKDLSVVSNELLEIAETPEDRSIVMNEVVDNKKDIDQRRDYIIRSMLDATGVIDFDVKIAGMEYINGFESPDSQIEAERRVRVYNSIIQYAQYNGRVPDSSVDVSISEALSDSTPRVESGSTVKLHGKSVEGTGKSWYNITDPRTVEYIVAEGKVRVGENITATYQVIDQTRNDKGELVVTVNSGYGHDGKNFTVIVAEDSRQWRFSKDGNLLELYIPKNSASLEQAGVYAIEKYLESGDENTRVAVSAAGANLPNIIESFEYPDHANPVPVSVAKKN